MLSRMLMSQVKHNSYFLVGLALGLWVALVAVPLDDFAPSACEAPVNVSPAEPAADEFEPQHEQRPLGAAGPAASRSVQRPRYYTTELGMRGSLLAGVLSSAGALGAGGRARALNATAARLQPALRFFMAAGGAPLAPPLANVVGFTDAREMLQPFLALKYLADNYLDEYDFFFLAGDSAFVNARRLAALAAGLSVSRDVYMGVPSSPDGPYCSLESGVLLSNSVLRAVHGELDWCVRNSYSPHHHENVGRCVLHAAHRRCAPALQGRRYGSLALQPAESQPALRPALADAVTVTGLDSASHFHLVHAYVARVRLERTHERVRAARAAAWRGAVRHPPGYRNGSWPGGLRLDPGLAPPAPDSRFDHLRWTAFNATHALMPDEHRASAPLAGAALAGARLVAREATAWAARRWGGAPALAEGAWRWEPATTLRYRLLLRVGGRLVRLEAARALGAARLVPVPYVTESARVTLAVRVAAGDERDAADLAAFLARYEAVALAQDKNTALVVVCAGGACDNATVTAAGAVGARAVGAAGAGGAAWAGAALGAAARDALLLLLPPHAEFNQDFLNRVRMNTIAGAQWFLAVGFARYALYSHPQFSAPGGGKPHQHTGRFNAHHDHALAVYRQDLEAALSTENAGEEGEEAEESGRSVAEVLARSKLRCVRAPEPGLVLAPRGPPRPASGAPGAPRTPLARLDLGARHSLAQLLLQYEAAQA